MRLIRDMTEDELRALVAAGVREALAEGQGLLTLPEAARRLGMTSARGDLGLRKALSERALRDPALAACFVQSKPGAARRVDPAKLSSYIHKRTAPEASDGG